jgi:hypothetical protein
VRVCNIRGIVHVYPEGRYAINDPTFIVGQELDLARREDPGVVMVQNDGPVSLVRVPLGMFGFADQNAHPVILLPGLHLVKDAKFQFKQ